MRKYSGFTTETAQSLLLNAGAFFKNFDPATDTFDSAVAAGKLIGATKGGGEFFGRVGSFEEGYEFDALVIDDSSARTVLELDIAQRLELIMYLGHAGSIVAKWVAGRKVI